VALPETIRVKISSEAAEFISITPVVVRQMLTRELIEAMLGVTGKDPARVQELLRRGSLVAGASRFRWDGWEADRMAIEAALSTFPDPDPGLLFSPGRCVRAVLKGRNARIEIPREIGSERRLLRKRSFWDALMEVAESSPPRYAGYCYRERADHYALDVPPSFAARIRESAGALRYSSLEAQIRGMQLELIEFYVERTPAPLGPATEPRP
jgi:hypothetical protein